MSTFLIIVAIISLLGGLMSRSNGRVYITDENKEKVKVRRPEYAKPNKSDLRNLIINEASDKMNAYQNTTKLVKLCQNYFNNYGWDVQLLEVIINAFVTDKKFDEAYKYASILCSNKLSYKWGFFLKGEICWYKGEIFEGSRFFSIAVTQWGMDEEYVKLRKKELIPYVKPRDERDRRKLAEEKNAI
jgi:hypothetical protein